MPAYIYMLIMSRKTKYYMFFGNFLIYSMILNSGYNVSCECVI